MKSIIGITDSDEGRDVLFPILGKFASSKKWIKVFHANVKDHKPFIKFLNITHFPSYVFLSANYSTFDYLVSDDFNLSEDFSDEKLKLNSIETPSELYGGVKTVSEYAFERLEKPFFTLFNSAFCAKCKTMKMAYLDAAFVVKKKLNWAMWDVTQSTPSFQRNLSIGIPSVWYFNSSNVFEGEAYSGPSNYLSVVEWIYSKSPTFDLDQLMRQELGGDTFDSI